MNRWYVALIGIIAIALITDGMDGAALAGGNRDEVRRLLFERSEGNLQKQSWNERRGADYGTGVGGPVAAYH
jgi:hypothetical protein